MNSKQKLMLLALVLGTLVALTAIRIFITDIDITRTISWMGGGLFSVVFMVCACGGLK